jgi:LDH2 family malate/lactate/ureidoglycolate dehydrogenase
MSNGLVNTRPNFKLIEKTPVVAHLDRDNVVATRAVEEAVKRAETYRIGVVTANHSNHFGIAAIYVLQVLEKNIIS